MNDQKENLLKGKYTFILYGLELKDRFLGGGA